MKPPDDDSLQLEVVTGETGDCSGQVRRLKDSGMGLGLVITTNLNNNWNISVFMFQQPVGNNSLHTHNKLKNSSIHH